MPELYFCASSQGKVAIMLPTISRQLRYFAQQSQIAALISREHEQHVPTRLRTFGTGYISRPAQSQCLNAQLTIENAPTAGTKIKVLLPIKRVDTSG
jgi:hypothetical protein